MARGGGSSIRDYVIAISMAVLIALAIRTYFFEAYRIPSSAMSPTLESGDTIFVAKWPFGIFDILKRKPFIGEVVVYSPPNDPGRDFARQIVGLPGDTVEIRKGRVVLNGKETGANADTKTSAKASCGEEVLANRSFTACWDAPVMPDAPAVKVPEDSVYVLGDSRSQGPAEKRQPKTWGTIPAASLKGSALWIWLSIEQNPKQPNSNWFSRIRLDRMFKRIHSDEDTSTQTAKSD